jgi:uncharacterized membrane protein YoaK (UPF0700 family)
MDRPPRLQVPVHAVEDARRPASGACGAPLSPAILPRQHASPARAPSPFRVSAVGTMPYRSPGAPRRPAPRERPWVFAGAIALAGVAGFVNVVVLGYFHVPVSHMSGAVSRLSVDVAAADAADLRVVLSIVGGFLLGAVVSGVIIGGRKLVPGRRYGVALLVEGGLLALSTALLRGGNAAGITLAATACGVQNAMASSYYGLVIRTTHVTGIVTDLGVMVGHWLRHRRIPAWKLLLLLSILVGFFGGGVAGALAYRQVGVLALAMASAGCLAAGGVYLAWRHALARSP